MLMPALKIVNGQLQDPAGNRVILRGVNAEGMAGVATFFPGGLAAYLGKLTQKDASGGQWFTRAVRLPFERYPCTDQGRLYRLGDPRIASCIPNTNQVQAWPAATIVPAGTIRSFNGQQYMATVRSWRADKGQAWNPGAFQPGDVVAGLPGNTSLYRCTQSTLITDPALLNQAWDKGPQGTSANPQTDGLGNVWVYVGEFGLTGTSQPFAGPVIFDGLAGATTYFKGWQDNLCQWRIIGSDLTPAQADAAWSAWTANVLDPAVQSCVDQGLYAVVCMFDFGPAHHPLLSARLLDFWARMSHGKWANHPNVIFDLWNESESVGAFDGFSPGSWANQKPVIQSVVDLIRSNGVNNLVLVPTPGFCAYTDAATASPLTGTNLVYAAHHYSQFFYGSPADWTAHVPNPNGGNHLNLERALSSGQPVMLSEWGPSNWTDTQGGMPAPDVAPFVSSLQTTVESSAARPAVGWLAWAWTQNWTPALFADGADSQPTVFGTVVRQWLFDKKDDSQPGGSAPAPIVQTAAPIVDQLASPTSAEPIVVTGKLAPVVAPPPPPPPPAPPIKTPAQIAADALLADAQRDLVAAQGAAALAENAAAAAQVKVSNVRAVIDALAAGH